MKYRIATPEDAPAITHCIASTEYYHPIDASQLDGTVLVAENQHGGIAGCIWVMHCGRHALIDLLAVDPIYKHEGIGVKLAASALQLCREIGVKYLRAAFHNDNSETIKLARAFGMITDPNYSVGFLNAGAQDG